jgi:meso-butanediol dehydrogenase/(S,S)-butanediol dehydrogenase/diacetyl reductase
MAVTSPVCVITGGNAGIGLAVARLCASKGYRLALCGRDADTLSAVHDELEKLVPDILAMQLDFVDPDAARHLVASAIERFGRLDLLVNNAGSVPKAPVADLADDAVRAALAVNCEAVFQATKAAWPTLQAQGGGVIVNISSLASLDPFTGFSVYGACKAWVNLFTKAIGDEGRPHNIRAFALALGAVETRLLREVLPTFPADQALPPEAVAEFILTLTADTMRYASGQTLVVRR